MPKYQLSRLARLDLFEIADYTVDTWGSEQAVSYLESLIACIGQIASTPSIGRSCGKIRTGYRRMEHQKHVIFYRVAVDSTFVARVLHQARMPSLQCFEED